MNFSDPTYSIIVPVYNSTQSVIEISERINNVFSETIKDSFEIIFVDDCSPNKETWPVLKLLSEKYPYINAYQLTRNFGKAGAVLCGFHQAKGKYIITMDDDIQHLPEDIPALIKEKGHDIVMGHFTQKNHPFLKKITSKVNSYLETLLIGKPSHIQSSPFKLINRTIVDSVIKIRTPYPFISALLYYVTKDIATVKVTHGKREFGETGFTIRKVFSNFFNLIFNNSSFLLNMIASVGFAISILSFILGTYFIIKKITVGTAVQGWASLAVINLFLGGLILFSLGILGEYLIRIINGNERRPPFIVRKKT